MNAEIIAVGSELLLGQIANTNGQFISRQLAELGINVYYHTVVGDNHERLTNALNQAKQRSDLIILTGGLGPTKDDMTKDTVCTFTNQSLEYNEEALHTIQLFSNKRNIELSEKNKRQALVIAGAVVFTNRHGLAPGMAFEHEKCTYILLPGPPKELEPMVVTEMKPYIVEKLAKQEIIHSKVMRFFNIGESKLETEISDLIDAQTDPTIAPLAADGEVTLRLTSKANSREEALRNIAGVENIILNRVGSYFYGYDDTSLFAEVKKILTEKNLTLASAESLTGGLFSQQITSLPGASAVYNGAVVCYTNAVKENVIGVSKETIEKHGVVSVACASEMAEGVRVLCGADIGISFTGVAGPSMQEGKEVGTVYIGISHENGEPTIYTLKLTGSRQQIQNRTIKYGSFYLLNELKKVE